MVSWRERKKYQVIFLSLLNEISQHIEKCVTYTNNKLDGPTIYYYDNGLVEHIEQYSEGEKCGTWKYFNNQGELIRNVYY